jgi:diguanylate cyclase (GGDEF)-like protein
LRRFQRILVADDAPQIHDLLATRLASLEVELQRALTAEQALALAREDPPDLVLLDVYMPQCGGFEVCRRLKEEPATRDVPVIFLTGANQAMDKIRGFDLGAVDYIVKPFDPAELRARVQSALRTKSLLDMLTEQAQIDGLSGLHNRRFFDRRLREELRLSRRHARWLGLVLLDLDGFKQINDRMGHPKGDAVLQTFSTILKDNCRVSDIACRYGGDEFALILPATDAAQTQRLARRLSRQIKTHRTLHGMVEGRVDASLGAAATGPGDSSDAEALLDQADAALYRSKAAGRGQVVLGQPAA